MNFILEKMLCSSRTKRVSFLSNDQIKGFISRMLSQIKPFFQSYWLYCNCLGIRIKCFLNKGTVHIIRVLKQYSYTWWKSGSCIIRAYLTSFFCPRTESTVAITPKRCLEKTLKGDKSVQIWYNSRNSNI
jgi:hypothetical protein